MVLGEHPGEGGDTVVFSDDDFGLNTILNFEHGARTADDLDDVDVLDFGQLLDVDAAERGASANHALDADDNDSDGFVPFSINGAFDGDSAAGPDFTFRPDDELVNEGAHNSIEALSFEHLWGELDTDDRVESFADFGTSELEALLNDAEPNPDGQDYSDVDPSGGLGDASPEGNQFLVLVANDALIESDEGDPETTAAPSDWFANRDDLSTEFKVFQGTIVQDDEPGTGDYSYEITNEAGIVDLGSVNVFELTTANLGIDVS